MKAVNLCLLVVIVVLLTRCEKGENAILPQVTTTDITSILVNGAKSGGTITTDGGSSIIAKGVCWSVTENPTIDNFKTNEGSGTAGFTSSLTGLDESTHYYVRAYATNDVGTSYGEEVSFVTSGKPVVETLAISDLTLSSASGGGRIISNGNEPILDKGICWSTNPAPTIADNKISTSNEGNDYSTAISGLMSNARYYLRAYATNSFGTGYGEEISFAPFAAMDEDGNGYHSVKIGTQVWMVEDLRVVTYRNGDPIPNVKEDAAWGALTTGAYCDYANDPENTKVYGRLYNWYAVNDSRNIAPAGWHIATSAEWNLLTAFLGGEEVAGGALKDVKSGLWVTPNFEATNETGFTAIPGGTRAIGYRFKGIREDCEWWTATEYDATSARGQWVFWSGAFCRSYYGAKKIGSYVRCVKD